MKKILFSTFIILCVVIIIICYNTTNKTLKKESLIMEIKNDLISHKENFEKVVDMFPNLQYTKINKDNYNTEDENLKIIFEELNYTEIYSDFDGSIYFNKIDKGLEFNGLVYIGFNSQYIREYSRGKVVTLEEGSRWIAYFSIQTGNYEKINNDFQQYQEVFERIMVLFPNGEYYKISKRNYDTNNEDLYFIFEKLKYTEVYSDFKGNIFFNKFDEGLSFFGLVYLNHAGTVVGIIKTSSIVLDNEGKWIAHYAHGL